MHLESKNKIYEKWYDLSLPMSGMPVREALRVSSITYSQVGRERFWAAASEVLSIAFFTFLFLVLFG